MKKCSVLFVFVLMMLSCSNDADINMKSNNYLESQILEFSSSEQMDLRISEVFALKQEKEAIIVEKILQENNRAKQNSKDISISNSEANDIDYAAVRGAVEFYHKERLNSIYELRRELGFTSLQSIADEINSLKLLDPKKSIAIYEKHSGVLNKSGYETYSVFGELLANVLNSKGQVIVNDELLTLDVNDFESRISFQTPEEDDIMGGGGISAPSGSSGYINDACWLPIDPTDGVSIVTPPIIIRWEVGRMRDTVNWFYRYAYFTRLRGFIRVDPDDYNNYQYYSYPITLDVGSPSYCKFRRPGGPGFTVNFRKTGTGYSFFNYNRSSRSFYLDELYVQHSTFSASVNGETISTSTRALLKDYDNPEDAIVQCYPDSSGN